MVEGAPAHGTVAHLLPLTYKRYVSEWLEEDTPSFDYGGFVVGEEMSEAKLLGKSEVSRRIKLRWCWTDILGNRCWCAVLR
jgi:nicotinate-nucleotide pyrophosphorylase (carboxylating)